MSGGSARPAGEADDDICRGGRRGSVRRADRQTVGRGRSVLAPFPQLDPLTNLVLISLLDAGDTTGGRSPSHSAILNPISRTNIYVEESSRMT